LFSSFKTLISPVSSDSVQSRHRIFAGVGDASVVRFP
jgi:hypothetical protein